MTEIYTTVPTFCYCEEGPWPEKAESVHTEYAMNVMKGLWRTRSKPTQAVRDRLDDVSTYFEEEGEGASDRKVTNSNRRFRINQYNISTV